jgi:SAM-dependent methyltransferase
MKSERSLFTAAVESGHIFNQAVREVAETSGLLDLLHNARSVDEVVRVMGLLPERTDQVRHMLRALAAEGVVTNAGPHPDVYQTDKAVRASLALPDNGRYRPRMDRIQPWFGDRHVDAIRASNKQLLGADLDFFRSPTAAIEFSAKFEAGWRTNLQNPLYEFGRVRLVEELVRRGSRFMDLACGPGYGLARLADASRAPCTVLAVDKSADFLRMARAGSYPNATISFVHRDLNLGLPPVLPRSFDGVLFNGAFHFIEQKPQRLREIWRALRPGGLLALGHCFSHSGFADEPMHDFYFSMLADRAYVLPWLRIKELVGEVGFDIQHEFHRGSHSYLLAERPVTALDDDRPPSAVETTIAIRGGDLCRRPS